MTLGINARHNCIFTSVKVYWPDKDLPNGHTYYNEIVKIKYLSPNSHANGLFSYRWIFFVMQRKIRHFWKCASFSYIKISHWLNVHLLFYTLTEGGVWWVQPTFDQSGLCEACDVKEIWHPCFTIYMSSTLSTSVSDSYMTNFQSLVNLTCTFHWLGGNWSTERNFHIEMISQRQCVQDFEPR